jgi:hypothetical protein
LNRRCGKNSTTCAEGHREEFTAVLVGPHARTLAELFRAFSAIECVKPAQLIGFVGAIDWGAIDYQTRLVVFA